MVLRKMACHGLFAYTVTNSALSADGAVVMGIVQLMPFPSDT